ncbi:MAG: cytochrome c biogenesis heme-transporting ATPase CcmA [Marinobacter sp.]|uniref:cytochrome c biogenesis heme-transporting ATPase CcmA n=1 Tax=Marinobacter sp. TaxID=50741 RepID=UPI0034A069B8
MSEPLKSAPLLQAIGLSCERDDRLLFQSLDFSIVPGSLTRVEGANGSGKTTLLRILAGLHDGFEGQVLWQGQPLIADRETFLRNLLFMGHRPGVKPLLTPLENLRFLISGRQRVTDDQLSEALSRAGLAGFEDVSCQHLSAGQTRRVALARLLLSDEPLWILDEAFTAIDQQGVEGLEQLLVNRAAMGGAIILTTHHEPELPGMDRLCLGQGGGREF